MKTSNAGKDLIIKWECGGDISKYLKSYKCPAGVWTIGVGCTFYPDGTKVKSGESVTLEGANNLFEYTLSKNFEPIINNFVKKIINQNQFDALASFIWNIGVQAFKDSTILKKININPNDPLIEKEFYKWNKANGKSLKGLTNRRIDEANLYFKPV